MFAWIMANMATILISALLLISVAAIVRGMRKGKGTCSCGGSCSHCAMGDCCHKQ